MNVDVTRVTSDTVVKQRPAIAILVSDYELSCLPAENSKISRRDSSGSLINTILAIDEQVLQV